MPQHDCDQRFSHVVDNLSLSDEMLVSNLNQRAINSLPIVLENSPDNQSEVEKVRDDLQEHDDGSDAVVDHNNDSSDDVEDNLSELQQRARRLSATVGLFRIRMFRMLEESNEENLTLTEEINRLNQMISQDNRPNRPTLRHTRSNDNILGRRVQECSLTNEDGWTKGQVCLNNVKYVSALYLYEFFSRKKN